MMNAYEELRDRHSREVNAFPMFFAYDDDRFKVGMRKFGLTPEDTDKICRIGGTGGFCLRSDASCLNEMLDRHEKERQEAIDGDPTGNGYIYDMFCFELSNHEYTYTYDPEDTLDALELSWDEVNSNAKLLHGLNKAMAALRKKDNN